MGVHPATRRQLAGAACLGVLAGVALLVSSPAELVGTLAGLADHPVRFGLALTAAYLVRPFLLWPVTALAVVVGYLYGPAVGVPVALAGTALSNLPPYLLARRADTDAGVLGVLGGRGRELIDTVGRFRGILAARLLPLPGDAVSYAAGLSGLSAGTFLAGTVVGEIPWAVVAVLAGDSMRRLSLSAAGLPAQAVVVAVGLAGLLLAGPVYERVTA